MPIQPKDFHYIIKREDSIRKTKGGLVIPDIAQNKRGVGFIHALPLTSDYEGELKIGDKVLFSNYVGKEIDYENEILLFVEEDDILGKVENV